MFLFILLRTFPGGRLHNIAESLRWCHVSFYYLFELGKGVLESVCPSDDGLNSNNPFAPLWGGAEVPVCLLSIKLHFPRPPGHVIIWYILIVLRSTFLLTLRRNVRNIIFSTICLLPSILIIAWWSWAWVWTAGGRWGWTGWGGRSSQGPLLHPGISCGAELSHPLSWQLKKSKHFATNKAYLFNLITPPCSTRKSPTPSQPSPRWRPSGWGRTRPCGGGGRPAWWWSGRGSDRVCSRAWRHRRRGSGGI